MSLDGHDKLCGYQKSMFSLCIYGGLDTYSGRMNILRVWTSNNNPKVIARFYFEYLFKSRGKTAFCTEHFKKSPGRNQLMVTDHQQSRRNLITTSDNVWPQKISIPPPPQTRMVIWIESPSPRFLLLRPPPTRHFQ